MQFRQSSILSSFQCDKTTRKQTPGLHILVYDDVCMNQIFMGG